MSKFDWLKALLLTGMAITLLLLFREWDQFQNARLAAASPAVEAASDALGAGDVPALELPSVEEAFELPDGSISSLTAARLVQVTTDVLDIEIDLLGGDIVSAKLPQHSLAMDDPTPFGLLSSNPERIYIAQSGLVGPNGTDSNAGRPLFRSATSRYILEGGQNEIQVDLSYALGEVRITKRFILSRGDYDIRVQYLIDNRSAELWLGRFYAQIKRSDFQPQVAGRLGASPYLGAAVTTPDNRYLKLEFADLADESYRQSVDSGWVAMLQHYFITAWIPDPNASLEYDLRKAADANLYYLGFRQPLFQVSPGETASIDAQLYIGPKDQYRLAEIHPDLDLTVDYGWLWWAAQPLFWLLQKIHSLVGNWGVSIILLTLVVKLAFFRLSATSYKSMARMRKLQPKMQALKERYAEDRQAFSQEMMRLYQKEKVNPLGGCLPILVQMPVFIALYWVLLESVELRHAPFFGWIQDLSDKDPWFILPLIMGASMFLQQKLNPMPPDPTQAKVMQMMPIIFTFMFMWFPSGLVLYWCVNNILSMAQQWVITRRIEASA